jgi:hypothetical protein
MTQIFVTDDSGKQRLLLELDAMPREVFDFSQEATEHPIETGADVTDHVRTKPQGLTLDGIVSNTPIMRGEDVIANGFAVGPGEGVRAAHARDALLSLEGRTCTVVTEFRKYVDMVCLTISSTRAPTTSDTFSFTATFRQIHTVQTLTVRVDSKVLHGNGAANLGHKPATKAPAEVEDRRSWLLQGVDAVKGFLKPKEGP